MQKELTREEAFNYIKRNFKRFQNEGKLAEVMVRYMNKYFNKYELIEDRNFGKNKKNEALELFDGTLPPMV